MKDDGKWKRRKEDPQTIAKLSISKTRIFLFQNQKLRLHSKEKEEISLGFHINKSNA